LIKENNYLNFIIIIYNLIIIILLQIDILIQKIDDNLLLHFELIICDNNDD